MLKSFVNISNDDIDHMVKSGHVEKFVKVDADGFCQETYGIYIYIFFLV